MAKNSIQSRSIKLRSAISNAILSAIEGWDIAPQRIAIYGIAMVAAIGISFIIIPIITQGTI